MTAPGSPWSAAPTRTTPSPRARRRWWASTCGSTPTTSSTRTSARTTSTPGSTPWTGRRWPSATTPSRSRPAAKAGSQLHGRSGVRSGVMRILPLALLACALSLTLAAPASASRNQESIFEDEHQLLELGPVQASRTLDELDALGADTVRSLVLWNRLAPGGARRPKGFKAADPRGYAAALWDPY